MGPKGPKSNRTSPLKMDGFPSRGISLDSREKPIFRGFGLLLVSGGGS